MSFNSLETTFAPLEIVFPEVPKSTVLPVDIEALNETLKTLMAAQQAVCEQAAQLAYQHAVQAIRLDAHEYIIRMLEQAVLARQRMFGSSFLSSCPPRAACSMRLRHWRSRAPRRKTWHPFLLKCLCQHPRPAPASQPSNPHVASAPHCLRSWSVSMWCMMCLNRIAPAPAAHPWWQSARTSANNSTSCPCKYACCATSASATAVQAACTRPSPPPCHRSHCPRATPVPTSWRCSSPSSSSMACRWRALRMYWHAMRCRYRAKRWRAGSLAARTCCSHCTT